MQEMWKKVETACGYCVWGCRKLFLPLHLMHFGQCAGLQEQIMEGN